MDKERPVNVWFLYIYTGIYMIYIYMLRKYMIIEERYAKPLRNGGYVDAESA